MKNKYKGEMLELRYTNVLDNYFDYEIFYNDNYIGTLQLTLSDEKVFIRHIYILEQFRRNGYATRVVGLIRDLYNKPICLCISQNSESATPFWMNVFSKSKSVKRMRGHIYQISDGE